MPPLNQPATETEPGMAPTTPGLPVADVEPADPAPVADVSGLKSALEAERKAKRGAETALRELRAEVDQLRQATATDAEKALLAARKEERERVAAEYETKLQAAEAGRWRALKVAAIKGDAAGEWHDLEDVVMALIDNDEVTVDPDTGQVKGVAKALKALKERKPHWIKATGGGANHSAPAGGTGGTPAAPKKSDTDLLSEAMSSGRYSRF